MRKRLSVFLFVTILSIAAPSFALDPRDIELREPVLRKVVRVIKHLIGVRSSGDTLRPPIPCDPAQATCS